MELAAVISTGGAFLLAVFGGAFLLSPNKQGYKGKNNGKQPPQKGSLPILLQTYFLPVCVLLPAVFGFFLLPREGGVARLWSGLLLCGGFLAVGRMDQMTKEAHEKGLGGIKRFALLASTALAAVLAAVLSGEGLGALAVPFLGQARLGGWIYPLLVLLFAGAGEAFVSLDVSDSLCCSYVFAGSAGVLCCSVLLSLGSGQILAGALAGGALGFSLWSLSGAAVSLGRQGTLFCAGVLAAASLYCGLPLLLVFFLPLPLLDRLLMWLSAEKEDGAAISQRLFRKGVASRNIVFLYFLTALLGAVAAVMWVIMMYGRG